MKIKYTTRIFLLLILSILSTVSVNAEKPLENKISIWFGTRDIKHSPTAESITSITDILDYYDYSNGYPAYEYLGFASHQWWNNYFETDVRVTLNSSLRPNSLYLKGIYKTHKNFGFSVLYNLIPQNLRLSDVFIDYQPKVNTYIRQTDGKYFFNYDHCLGLGVYIPLDFKFLHLNISLNAGLDHTFAFNRTVYLTAHDTNYRAIYDYNFESTNSLFLFPEMEFNIDIFTSQKMCFGLQIQSSWLGMYKNQPYTLKKSEWTNENNVSSHIKLPPQFITKFEFDGGLYFRW